MRPTDRVHRVNGVRPSRRALAILPRLLPLSQSLIKHVRIVLFKSGNHLGMPEGFSCHTAAFKLIFAESKSLALTFARRRK